MAGPITWRNVGTTVSGNSASLLSGAQESFNSGFDVLNKVLEQRKTTQDANWEQGTDNNTQSYLDQVAQYKTPEELAAAREQGVFSDLRQQYGSQLDRGAARTALDGQGDVLRQRELANRQYQDDTTERDNRPLRGQITDLVLDGKEGEANALFDANADKFVDADAVRRGLFGDSTSYNSESRSQAGELRAQAGERRAQAGERRAQENQGWTRKVRNRQEDAWNTEDTAEGYMTEAVNTYQEAHDQFENDRNNIARDLGIGVENGQPVINSETPTEALAAYYEQIKPLEAAVPGAAEIADTYEDWMRQDGSLNPMERDAVRTRINSAIDGSGAMTQKDQSALTEQLSSTEAANTKRHETEVAKFEETARNNPFLEGRGKAVSSPGSAVDMVMNNQVDPMFFEGSNQRDMVDAVLEATTQGVPVGNQMVVPPDGFVKAAFAGNRNNWFDPAEDFSTSLGGYIESNWEAYRESLVALEEHENNLNRIELENQQRLGSVEESFLNQRGRSSVTPADTIAGLERELERRRRAMEQAQ